MKKKIIIIDDSKAMRLIVRRTLRQAGLGDHDVVEACDGREGYGLIRKCAPDLVLSDWNMPEMSGFELLTDIRRNSVNVKFGFVTTEGTAEMRAAATEAGALFMITKPFTPETFRQ